MADHSMNGRARYGERDLIELTRDNLADTLNGLPRKVAMIMRALTMMRYGSVQVTVPGGKTFRSLLTDGTWPSAMAAWRSIPETSSIRKTTTLMAIRASVTHCRETCSIFLPS